MQNNSWYNATQNSTAEHEMKAALHKGTYSDLNIYATDLNGTYCTQPTMSPSDEQLYLDGCRVILRNITSRTCDYYMKGILPEWFRLGEYLAVAG